MRKNRIFVLLLVSMFLLSAVVPLLVVTRYGLTNPTPISPLPISATQKESNGSSTLVFSQATSVRDHWYDIDFWATSSGQLPPKMNGTFTAVANDIGGLEPGDSVLYIPLNVAYGLSSANCVWFQFDVEFDSGYTGWYIWDVLGPAGDSSDYHYQSIGISYVVGDVYNFEVTTSGYNTVTFSIKDVTSGAHWSTSSWEWTVPSLTLLYDATLFSPASAVEGYTTSRQLSNVPLFQTYVGYNLQTWSHGWDDLSEPSGVGTQVSGGPGFYYWSMFSPSPTVKVVATGLSEPWGVALTPDGAYAYVTDYASDSVSVINTATNHVTATIVVGGSPTGVAITPDGAYAYVTNPGSNSVSVINTATNHVTSTITVGAEPFGVAITPNGRHVYVTFGVFSNLVLEISTVTNTVEATIPVDWDCFGVAVSPDGTHTYVTCYSGLVYVLNAANTVTATISGLYALRDVAFTPNGAYAYVTDSGNGLGNGTVSVINTATNTIMGTVTNINGPSDIEGLSVSPNGAYVYVTNAASGTVSVINTATNKVTATIPVGTNPVDVAIAPDGVKAYVSNSNNPGSLSVIDTATNTVTATLPGISADGPLIMDVGQSQMFTAERWDGTGVIHYQWYIDAGAVGTDSSTYSYNASGSSASVTCKVTDSASPPRTSPISNAVDITVNPAQTVTVTPTSVMMSVGQTKQFTCAAAGGTGTLHYQWYLADSAISGETGTSYNFTAPSAGSPTIYCQVTDHASSPLTVQSNTPSITVAASPTVSIAPLGPLTMDVGQSQIFVAIPSGGSGSYTSYQWYIGGFSQTSAKASTLNYSTSSEGSISVTVTVTDSLGATSAQSNATTVTVAASPNVAIAPADPVSLIVGQAQTFTATASGGTQTLSCQWFLDGFAVSGATTASYTYVATGTSHTVTCEVTDSASTPVTSSSNIVTVTVNPAATPTPTPTPTPTTTATPTPVPSDSPTPPSTSPTPTPTIAPSPTLTPTINPTATSTQNPISSIEPSNYPTSDPNSTPKIGEFPSTILVLTLILIISAVVSFFKKHHSR